MIDGYPRKKHLLHGSGLPCEIPSDIEVYLMLGTILGLYQSFDKIYF